MQSTQDRQTNDATNGLDSARFVAVLTMIALAGIIGAALSRGIPETA
jgi:hypothetical protein